MNSTDFLIRLSFALLAGVIIGIEREWRLRSAGLLTNSLVSIGAAIYVMASTILVTDIGDPSRVLGQIATGIGFLGAGVIMRDGLNIHGLNSAATIWCSAAVGSLSGLGLITEAFIAAATIVVINLCVRWIADMISRLAMKKKDILNGSTIHFYVRAEYEAEFRVELMHQINNYPALSLKTFYYRKANMFSSANEMVCEITYDKHQKVACKNFITSISTCEYLLKLQHEDGIIS